MPKSIDANIRQLWIEADASAMDGGVITCLSTGRATPTSGRGCIDDYNDIRLVEERQVFATTK